jgi:hypothetical protein
MQSVENRDNQALYRPKSNKWSHRHILFPKKASKSDGKSFESQAIYLHDYPLPVHEILHFFGFNLELGTREVWENCACAYTKPSWEDNIDIIDLLGSYSCESRTVRLFMPSLKISAQNRNWDLLGLAEVVRIHEYAHAIHHQGAPPSARSRLWEPWTSVQIHKDFEVERQALLQCPTDLDLFQALRRKWFERLYITRLETFAQAATAVFVDYLDEVYGPRPSGLKSLKQIFWELTERQPQEYRLKGILPSWIDWRIGGGLIREIARGEWERNREEPRTLLRSSIINHFGVNPPKGEEEKREYAAFIAECFL